MSLTIAALTRALEATHDKALSLWMDEVSNTHGYPKKGRLNRIRAELLMPHLKKILSQ